MGEGGQGGWLSRVTKRIGVICAPREQSRFVLARVEGRAGDRELDRAMIYDCLLLVIMIQISGSIEIGGIAWYGIPR